VSDRPSVDTLAFYNLMTCLAGLATLVVPLVTSFAALAAISAAFGLFVSANYVLTTVILVELVGVDRLTDAVGIVSFAQGIANLVGPPLAGTMHCMVSDSQRLIIVIQSSPMQSSLIFQTTQSIRNTRNNDIQMQYKIVKILLKIRETKNRS